MGCYCSCWPRPSPALARHEISQMQADNAALKAYNATLQAEVNKMRTVQKKLEFQEAMTGEPHNLRQHMCRMATGSFHVLPPEHYHWGLNMDVLTLTYHAHDGGEINVLATPIFLFGVPENLWDVELLFHYTNLHAFMKISEGRCLKITREGARPGDARHGDAIYVTSKGPDEHKTKCSILINNYSNKTDLASQADNIKAHVLSGDADYCIPLLVPPSRAIDVSAEPDMRAGRDVWIIPAEDEVRVFFSERLDCVRQHLTYFKKDAALKAMLKTLADTCQMTFLISGVDYQSLMARPRLLLDFKEEMEKVIADTAQLPRECIAIDAVKKSSVLVVVKVRGTVTASAESVMDTLRSSNNLGDKLRQQIDHVRCIDSCINAPVSVANLTFDLRCSSLETAMQHSTENSLPSSNYVVDAHSVCIEFTYLQHMLKLYDAQGSKEATKANADEQHETFPDVKTMQIFTSDGEEESKETARANIDEQQRSSPDMKAMQIPKSIDEEESEEAARANTHDRQISFPDMKSVHLPINQIQRLIDLLPGPDAPVLTPLMFKPSVGVLFFPKSLQLQFQMKVKLASSREIILISSLKTFKSVKDVRERLEMLRPLNVKGGRYVLLFRDVILQDEDKITNEMVAEGLEACGITTEHTAEEVLLSGLRSEDAQLRETACRQVEALGALAEPYVEELLVIVNENQECCFDAALALARLHHHTFALTFNELLPVARVLASQLDHVDAEVCHNACTGLGQAGRSASDYLSSIEIVKGWDSKLQESIGDGVTADSILDSGRLKIESVAAPGDALTTFLLARAQGRDVAIPPSYVMGYGVVGHEMSGILVHCPPVCLADPTDEDVALLYHYTDFSAFTRFVGNKNAGHLTSGWHWPMQDWGFSPFGDGIYATQRAPHQFESKDAVLINNWTNSSDPLEQERQMAHCRARERGAADYCIPLIVPRPAAVNTRFQKTKEMNKPGHTTRGQPLLEDRDVWVIVIGDATGAVQDEDRDSIFARLQDWDFSVRLHAVEVLAGFASSGDEKATIAIINALQDKDHHVCKAAIWGVAGSRSLTSQEAEEIIVRVVDYNHDESVKDTVCEARAFLMQQ